MPKQSAAEQDRAVAVVPTIGSSMPWQVTTASALPGFRIAVTFQDGLTGTVDMNRLVHSPKAGVFGRLADPELFGQLRIEYGAVAWPGEIDLAPDAMYDQIKAHGSWVID